MAPEVIDLISSSPSPPAQDQQQQHQPPAQDGGRSKRSIPLQSNALNTAHLFLSDDNFDTTDDDFLGSIDVKTTKRQRLSTSPPPLPSAPSALTAANTFRPFQPPLRSIAPAKTSRPTLDPIEFTSSIEPEVPEQRKTGKSRAPPATSRPAQTSKETPAQLALSLDPFASSPPCPAPRISQAPSKRPAIDEFSDPFASSPLALAPPCLPKASGSKPKPRAEEYTDPFASSPVPGVSRSAKAPIERRAVSFNVTERGQTSRRNDWDPIVSSSAPETSPSRFPPKASGPASRSQSVDPTVINIDSDSQDGSDDEEFPDIASFDVSKWKPQPRSPLRRSQSDIVSSKSRPRSTNTAPKKTADQRAREREAQTAARAAEKERKRQDKEQLKEAKAREKERAAALAEVNKIRTDKKVSTPEMIVLIPSGLDPGLKVQVETLLDGLAVEHTSWQSAAGNAFKWRRKVTSRFDEELGRWEPIPLRIKSESHALILLSANELVDLTLNDGLDASIDEKKRHFPGHQIVYILEGMTAWMRKNRNIRNRQFASGVRSQGTSDTTATSRGRRRNNNAASEEHISEDLIEDALLRLQVEHDVLIHHTAAPLETAQWVVAFTQHISTIPYKKQREQATAAAGFCMESGQVRTGEDARDTYVRMLQEIARVTAPVAYGIAAEFDSVSKLVSGLEDGGPGRLETVRKSANKDGALSDRSVGQAVSRRIYKVFTGRDEMSTDV